MSDSSLAILARAISDVGVWTWWTGEPTKAIQLEFSGVQLWFPPTAEGRPPSGQVALRYRNPSLVMFLSRSDNPDFSTDSWPTRFQSDEIGGFTVGYDEFTMTDAERAVSLIAQASHVIQLVGTPPKFRVIADSGAWIVFWAGNVGIAVAAAEMEIVSHHGTVPLSDVEERCGKWWEYWRDYWNKKDTDAALPRDYACEVTIPAAPE